MKLDLCRPILAVSLFSLIGCEKVAEPASDLPTATACTVATERLRVVFALSKEGVISVEDVPVSLEQVHAFARALVKMDPDIQIKLIADAEVDTVKVKAFAETAYGAGIKGVIFGSNVTEESEQR